MRRNHSIQTFVHRTLVIRLIATAIVVSLLIGLTALYVEQDKVSQEVINTVSDRLSVFSSRYHHLFADPNDLDAVKINQAIIEFRSSQRPIKLGSFLLAGVYDIHGKVIAEIHDEKPKILAKVKMNQQQVEINKVHQGEDQHEIILIAGLPYLRIALPIINNNRVTAGIVSGIFAFSPETIDAFRMRALRAMVSAIVIVLMTTLILYPVILRLTRRINRFSVQLLDANLATMEALGNAIAQRDSDTNAHNYRVTIYAVRIGEELDLSNQSMRSLIKGSFLHDVGKIGIPDQILMKPGKLDAKEFETMKTHVELGQQIIQRSKWLNDALDIVLFHHEKVQGNGYPKGLTDKEIPLTARIFAIADVFDALTSKRPYKEAWSFEQAMEIIYEGKGSHFDPVVIDAFSRIAKPLYDRFGGKEEVFREELGEIISKYFHEGMDSLEY